MNDWVETYPEVYLSLATILAEEGQTEEPLLI